MKITIDIPDNSKCLIKNGQKVDFAADFYETSLQTERQLYLADKIGVTPDKIFRYMKKFVGESVNKGETIAYKKDFFNSKKIVSDYEGIIKEIDHEDGKVVIASYLNEKTINKVFFKGTVEQIGKNNIVIEIGNAHEFPLKKAVTDFGGELCYLKKDSAKLEDVIGKVIISNNLSAYSQTKYEALDVHGFITLVSLPEKTMISNCQLQNKQDFDKITADKFCYCLIIKKISKIYFYS